MMTTLDRLCSVLLLCLDGDDSVRKNLQDRLLDSVKQVREGVEDGVVAEWSRTCWGAWQRQLL